ncbi:MAG: hypothetical protein FKY71_15460 [Spiribacter salinus]|uniref:Tetratricopeptide repeat protein n=1 Tax=Spiribacter salinus TaxID=1335746 RepID=A0A540VMY8_9GAMM|nr:MAG: hypothetical protein FKY71_15460 [Spiribacter salinus]
MPALLGVVALAVSAIKLRRRLPLYAAGIRFFLVGHLLESTFIPLELYFEHRNYLAGALLWLPVGGACFALGYRPWAPPVLMVAIVLVLAPLTHFRATTWGDPETLALTVTRENSESHWAYRFAASAFHKAGHPVEALMVLRNASERLPHHLPTVMHLAQQECYVTTIRDETLDTLRTASKRYLYHGNDFRQFDAFQEAARNPQCSKLSPGLAETIISNSLNNVPDRGQRHGQDKQQLHHLLGVIAIETRRACEAYERFRQSLEAYYDANAATRQAVLLAEAGLLNEALQHLESFKNQESASGGPLSSGTRPLTGRILTEDIGRQIRERWQELGRPGSQCPGGIRAPAQAAVGDRAGDN